MSTKRLSWQESQPGRRAGLSASNYRNRSLLSIVGAKNVSNQKTMPPNNVKLKLREQEAEDEASLLAPPVDTDSNSESDSKSANIKPTSFKSKRDEVKDTPSIRRPLEENSVSRRSARASGTKASGSAPRSREHGSSRGSSSQKRKSEDEDKVFGAAIRKRTVFDGSSTKKAKLKTQYGGVARPQNSFSPKSSRQSVKGKHSAVESCNIR